MSVKEMHITGCPEDLTKLIAVESILTGVTRSEIIIGILQQYFDSKKSKNENTKTSNLKTRQ